MRSELGPLTESIRHCITGIGVHAVRDVLPAELRKAPAPGLVLCAGVSGALVEGLTTGEIVVATHICYGDRVFAASPLQFPGLPFRTGTVYCSPRVVSQRSERLDIARRTGALCVDMESGEVAQICAEMSLPVAVLRVVMDTVDDVLPEVESPRNEAERAALDASETREISDEVREKSRAARRVLQAALSALLGV
ncbi:MAG: hypothetical protein AB1714_08865 [Acidobacteriota bacterium]